MRPFLSPFCHRGKTMGGADDGLNFRLGFVMVGAWTATNLPSIWTS